MKLVFKKKYPYKIATPDSSDLNFVAPRLRIMGISDLLESKLSYLILIAPPKLLSAQLGGDIEYTNVRYNYRTLA